MKVPILAMVLLLVLAPLLGCGSLSKAEKHFNTGGELYDQGRLEEAIAEYDEAIRLDPQLTLAYNNRAATYVNLGQYQKAIQDYDKVIRLNPQLVVAYNNRGFAYDELGQHERAIQDYDEAIRLNPQYE